MVTMPSSNLNYRVRKWCGGTEWAKKLIGLYKEIIFMNNDIKFLNIEWRTPYPLTSFEDRFELCASVIFL